MRWMFKKGETIASRVYPIIHEDTATKENIRYRVVDTQDRGNIPFYTLREIGGTETGIVQVAKDTCETEYSTRRSTTNPLYAIQPGTVLEMRGRYPQITATAALSEVQRAYNEVFSEQALRADRQVLNDIQRMVYGLDLGDRLVPTIVERRPLISRIILSFKEGRLHNVCKNIYNFLRRKRTILGELANDQTDTVT